MKKLSIIIVNYNVKYFLAHCLQSVTRAIEGLDAEVIVVDNNSTDGSKEMLQDLENIVFINNMHNAGFSQANNQGVAIANGEYVLLLNPDTLVAENTFSSCIEYIDNQPKVGALGVKMIDGQGRFLPESKRSFPSPAVSFYKLFGLSAFFPKSKLFGKYHLTYLPKNEIAEVDVLSGAFMMMRKAVFEEVGGLDQDYFMYGEDIDLSFKLTKAGYQNIYYPKTSIIHFKGESTKKTSYGYVKHFYKSMGIFSKKHLSDGKATLFNLGIKTAILFRALLTIIGGWLKLFLYIVIDGATIFGALYITRNIWLASASQVSHYPNQLLYINFPIYIALWLIACYFSGVYDRPFKPFRLLRGLIIGSILITIVYAFLPNSLRFSRMIILLGTLFAFLGLFIVRSIEHFLVYKNLNLAKSHSEQLVIVASQEAGKEILHNLNEQGISHNFVGLINPKKENANGQFIGNFNALSDIVKALGITELIFSDAKISYTNLIRVMEDISGHNIKVKITNNRGRQMLGSNSKNTAGDLYSLDISPKILTKENKRNKRVFDIIASVCLLILSPILIWFPNNRVGFLTNLLITFIGQKSWVAPYKNGPLTKQLKPGVLHPLSHIDEKFHSPTLIKRSNLNYASHFHINEDVTILLKNLKRLG